MKQFLKTNLIFLVLVIFDGLVITAHYLLKNKYGFFDLDGEGNLNSAYSGLKLLFIGGLVLFQFLILHKTKDKLKKRLVWLLTAASFIYLGTDEMMAIHERAGFVFNNLLGVSNSDGASFNWIIYFSPLIALALLVYSGFIIYSWQKNIIAGVWLLAGTLLLIAGLAIEALSGQVVYPRGLVTRDFSLYFKFIIIEEVVELVGASCFLTGVWHSVKNDFYTRFKVDSQE